MTKKDLVEAIKNWPDEATVYFHCDSDSYCVVSVEGNEDTIMLRSDPDSYW
jgi:hypothetical protein